MQTYAHGRGIDMQSVFTEMLNFFIETFSVESFIRYKGNMAAIFEKRRKDNPELLELLKHWIQTAEDKIASEGICDWFGALYEECFLGKTKASAMGQFFTPLPLCQVMISALSGDGERGEVVSEPSCGSGRNVLAHWQQADKSKLIFYRCEDLDPTSVKMCALNMMITGMYGSVVCHDSLDPTSFHFGYAVNEIRYPIPSPYYSVRSMSKDEYIVKSI